MTKFATQMKVSRPNAVGRVSRITRIGEVRQGRSQLVGHSLIGVKRENPVMSRGRDPSVALRRNRLALHDKDACTSVARQRDRFIGRTAVDDDYFISPIDACQCRREQLGFVERRNDHRDSASTDTGS
jgi:hypothetical protein